MMISEYALENFQVKENDDKQTILLKKYYLSQHTIQKRIDAETKSQDFNDKYNEINKLKNSKPTKKQLELQLAIEALLE